MIKLFLHYLIIGLAVVLLTNSCGLFNQRSKSNAVISKGDNKVLPEPIGYVNDFENILTKEQEAELTEIIKQHEKLTTDQITIVTVSSYAPYESLFDYSLELGNYWGVGTKEKNNGVLITLGKEIRKIQIMTGYGIEKRLTDADAKRIIDEIMIPEFKSDNYFGGVKKGLIAITAKLK